ncbi:TPA: hypothetical protein MBI04_003566 [Klebsiella pneumoniae]|nr:hypothetical protein [Klebsiella pneumoniae]
MDEEELINTETGRTISGKFAKGNQISRRKRKPREITAEVRQYADQENVTQYAVKRLKEIMLNKNGKATESESIRACEALLKHFSVSVEKDIDKDIAESSIRTESEMLVNILDKLGK